ncbi:hypothetical protein CcaverHIS002_0106460 [Cutaneotrichosporon cavernicola]|nr:hypothetical protein CcaverHIS002_0106460 [Cutaneotrichosporon cavernicola]
MSSNLTIHRAAQEGQPGLIRSLLADNEKLINAKDEDGRTPLHWAATANNLGVTQLLISNAADPEARDSLGWTPLLIAAAAGPAGERAKVDAANDKGQTALHYAASKGNVPMGRLLITRGAEINARDRANQHPLHRAATTGNGAFLNILLHPPEGRPKTRLNTADRAGNTPLHLALESGHGEAAVILLEAGADRERPNSEGQVAEEIDGVGGEEQRRVRQYVVSRCDPWWQSAIEAHAVDRVHRMGPRKTVRVFQLIAENTIEPRCSRSAFAKSGLTETKAAKKQARFEDLKQIFGAE